MAWLTEIHNTPAGDYPFVQDEPDGSYWAEIFEHDMQTHKQIHGNRPCEKGRENCVLCQANFPIAGPFPEPALHPEYFRDIPL